MNQKIRSSELQRNNLKVIKMASDLYLCFQKTELAFVKMNIQLYIGLDFNLLGK